MEPFFTNDAVVLGLLFVLLALIFYTSSQQSGFFAKFYTYVPALLLCYFLPALLNWPLGLIAPHWYDSSLIDALVGMNIEIPANIQRMSFEEVNTFLESQGLDKSTFSQYSHHSHLYFMASRYLLPAALILLCLSIDFQGFINLGWKAIVMFLAATLGIIIGGPFALLLITQFAPGLIENASAEEVWRGLSTVAGSWIGGGANQTAMKEIYEVSDRIFASMIVVDVVVANLWMAFLLYGTNISDRIDRWLKADNSAIEDLKKRVADYQAKVQVIPNMTQLFILAAIAFGGVAFSHFAADQITPFIEIWESRLNELGLNSLLSPFFWLIVFATTIGLVISFTKYRSVEGYGASKFGSIFIYILVATIGMKMNLGDVFNNLGLFAIGIIWMLVHVSILLLVGKIIRAPFFFVAVGSQANVGGAASAPIVASAFSPTLAPVGILMAVFGYAMGTYGAIICATLMQWVSS